MHLNLVMHNIPIDLCGLVYQRQVSGAGTRNDIPQILWGVISVYFSLSSIPASFCATLDIGQVRITMTSQWVGWRLKSPASWLFTQSFIRAQIKETSKPRVTGLCAGNSPGTGEFPAQMASNAETVSIWWRHHGQQHLARKHTWVIYEKF